MPKQHRPVLVRQAEALEPRRLFAVSMDAAGYTVVTPEGGDRVVYVSSSAGDDDRSGTSPADAVRSLGRGYALLRDGRGDQLMLKRGDTWRGGLPGWHKSGASADRPIVLGAYGLGDRPTVATGGTAAFLATGQLDHLVVQGIRFAATSRDPASPDFDAVDVHRAGIGVQVFATGSDILMEDCEVSHFTTNVAFQDNKFELSDVRLRRNVVVDAYADGSVHAQGLYAQGVRGLLLEENVFDHNGWDEHVGVKVPGAGRATIFNHNVYLTAETRDVVVRGNVLANAASHGLQARSGGDITDNLFVANPLHLSYGLVRGGSAPVEGGVSGIVNGNVFLGTRDIDGQPRGIGIEIANLRPGGPTLVSNNVFSNAGDNGVPWQPAGFAALMLAVGNGVDDAKLAVGINDLTIQGNVVYKWNQGLSLQSDLRPGAGGTNGYHHLTVKQNEFSRIAGTPVIDHPAGFDGGQERWSGNRYDAAGPESRWLRVNGRSLAVDDWSADATGDRAGVPKYAGPNRSLASYADATGGDARGVIAKLRATSAVGGADPRFTAAAVVGYVRDGFEDAESGAKRNWLAPTPPAAVGTLPPSVRTDETSLTVTVTYEDDSALDLSTIGDADVSLVNRGGRHLPATLVGVVPGEGGRSATATYRVASPAAVWRRKDRGAYKLVVNDGEVRDADGFAAEAGSAAAAELTVVEVPPPPTVRKVKFAKGKKDRPDSLSLTFSADLAGPPAGGDLSLAALSAVDPLAAPVPLDLSAATATYDPAKRRVTWTFPQMINGQLPAGSYEVRLSAARVVTAVDAKVLDGNADGLGGDDYLYGRSLKVKR